METKFEEKPLTSMGNDCWLMYVKGFINGESVIRGIFYLHSSNFKSFRIHKTSVSCLTYNKNGTSSVHTTEPRYLGKNEDNEDIWSDEYSVCYGVCGTKEEVREVLEDNMLDFWKRKSGDNE